MDLSHIKYLTFDCYGTLIDWESGILAVLQPLLKRHGCSMSAAEILRNYAKFESAAEQGVYKSYREVLREVVQAFGQEFGFSASSGECEQLPDSVGHWQPFPDTIPALQWLTERFQLVVLSNIDRDMIVQTAELLGNPFARIFSAEEIKSYKPDLRNFRFMQEHMGIEKEELLHVAQSKHHDIEPALKLGWKNVWVSRGRGEDEGATPESHVVPDAQVFDLNGLVEWVKARV